MKVRPRQAADHAAAVEFLARWGGVRMARLGELLDPLEFPAFLAEEGGQVMGMLTYVPDPQREQCEILTLHAGVQWKGTGTVLLEAVEQLAARLGYRRLWLITTNDNVDALRFYQRRGFRLAALHRGAVDQSRARLKPEIPAVGDYGIPLRDEVELEKWLCSHDGEEADAGHRVYGAGIPHRPPQQPESAAARIADHSCGS